MKKILVATDYSPASRCALEFATSLARDTGAVLLITHVTDREAYPVGELFDDDQQADPGEMRYLRMIVPPDRRIACEHRLLYAMSGSASNVKPAEVLVNFAKAEQVDAIVMGTHGRSGLDRFLMGSVAESVVRHAHCPVVTIKQPVATS